MCVCVYVRVCVCVCVCVCFVIDVTEGLARILFFRPFALFRGERMSPPRSRDWAGTSLLRMLAVRRCQSLGLAMRRTLQHAKAAGVNPREVGEGSASWMHSASYMATRTKFLF